MIRDTCIPSYLDLENLHLEWYWVFLHFIFCLGHIINKDEKGVYFRLVCFIRMINLVKWGLHGQVAKCIVYLILLVHCEK